jgi:hypothetical protein
MKMKLICVPKSVLAKHHLDFNESRLGELIELEIDNEVINKLFEIGFFHSLNKLTNANVDNFEDDNITGEERLLKVLNSNLFDKKLYDDDIYSVINKIKMMFNEALISKTGVYFYF